MAQDYLEEYEISAFINENGAPIKKTWRICKGGPPEEHENRPGPDCSSCGVAIRGYWMSMTIAEKGKEVVKERHYHVDCYAEEIAALLLPEP